MSLQSTTKGKAMDNNTGKDRSRDRSRRDRPTRFSESSRDRSPDRGGRGGGGQGSNASKSSWNRIYVSNIPYEFRWQDVKDLFRSEVGDVQFVELFVDEQDKPKGCGIIEFSDPGSVKKAFDVMQRYQVKGRKLVIKDDSGITRDKHGKSLSKRSGGGGDDRRRGGGDDRDMMGGSYRDDECASWGNTYGLSAQFLQTLNIEPPLLTKVFVANLAYNVDKRKLKEVFRLCGRIHSVELPLDKEGRIRGFAVIEFDHPVEAVQAISMLHNQLLYDRPLAVRLDRPVDGSVKLPEGLKGLGMGLGSNGEPLRNVALNLPSTAASSGNNQQQPQSMFGQVASPAALQVATALSSLQNPLGSLTSQPNLLTANLSSLLSSTLGNSDLLSNNLVQNSMQQQQQQHGGNQSNRDYHNRDYQNNGGSSGSGSGQGGYQSGGGYGGGYQTNYEAPNKRDNYSGNSGYETGSSQQQQQQQQGFLIKSDNNKSNINHNSGGGGGGYNKKVLVSNLPPMLSYKLLHKKFSEFGEIQLFEEKGQGNLMIEFASQWQAEAAVKNLDRARIDGRLLSACLV